MRESKQRILEKLAFRYWKRNPKRNAKTNWKLAKKLLNYIEKRKSLIIKIIRRYNDKSRS